jgi:hypothetical protein
MGLREWAFARLVAKYCKEASMGTLGSGAKFVWGMLNGWKSWIVALVAVYKLMCANCATSGYLTAVLGAVGWNSVTAAFDPEQFVTALAVFIALFHKIVKAYQEYRAGVPVVDIQSPPIPPVNG